MVSIYMVEKVRALVAQKKSDRTIGGSSASIAKPKDRFFEQQYEPGEQSQFDFKESYDFLDGTG